MKSSRFYCCFVLLCTSHSCHLGNVASAQGEPTAAQRVVPARSLLKAPAATVRLRAALALAEINDAEAIPVLIDLLAELPAEQRRSAEEFLTQLAGEWAPTVQFQSEDDISRRIRRDAWASWWRHTDGPTLLAAVRKHTLTPQARAHVVGLITNLGDEQFAVRENAAKELFALGRLTLPQLREASKHKDAEVARHAKLLIERIEREPTHHLPLAALRLLAVRKPAGSVETLLAYLPYAEDESRSDEVNKSLTTLALHEGKANPILVRALVEPQSLLRAAAGEALIKGAGEEGRSVARKLLQDDAPEVRLPIAVALAHAKELESIPVLINLLTVLPVERMGEIEGVLYQLAGDASPEVSLGTAPAERKKCRDGWAAWWKVNAAHVDLVRLTAQPWFGYTLVCDANQVYELDRHGKRRWSIENVAGPIDAWMLSGNRVLIAQWSDSRITERDLKGNILWQKAGLNALPTNVQRLPNGNTFITLNNGRMLEVDRAGKEIYTINNPPGNVLAAYRARNGAIVCVTGKSQCVFLDTTGKQLKSFALKHALNNPGCMDLLPNGHILVSSGQANKVMEFDSEGRMLREMDAPGVTTPTGLPNGHILVSCQGGQRIFELDRAGKIVWEHKGAVVYRTRRR